MSGQAVTYYADGVALSAATFSSAVAGNHVITAKVGSVTSAAVTVKVQDATPVPTTIALQLAKTVIAPAEKLDLAAVVKDQNGNVMSGQTVVFYRNGTALASNYLRTGIVGTYAITAKVGSVESAPVTVKVQSGDTPVVASVVLQLPKTQIAAGERLDFAAVVKDQNGNVMDGQSVVFYRNGVQTANYLRTSRTGTYTITAKVGDVTSAEVKVTVKDVSIATSVVVTPTKTTLTAGDRVYFYAVIKDQYGNVMSDAVPTYYRGKTVLTTNSYRTTTAGTYTFTAVAGTVTSAPITIVFKPAS